MTTWQYTKGLHDLDNDIYAYLQLDGTWGWSNAGLITDGEASLLIDTLFDLRLTGEMLGTMRRSLPAAVHIQEHHSDAAPTHLRGRIDRVYGQQNGASDRSGTGTTRGDTLVHITGDRVICTGDILFIGGHPIM